MDITNTTATGGDDPILDRLGFISEEAFIAFAAITPGTALAWRKRKQGPPWVRFGNRVFYPVDGLRNHLNKPLRAKLQAAAEAAPPVL